VIGNTIQNNTGVGVQVLRDSHTDIAGNTINNNGDGIEVGENSLVQLGEDSGASIYESANSGSNTGFGIKCSNGGVGDGRIGTLTGGSGVKNFPSPECIDSLSP
jgi:parallel beta-helix repeat protein